jgi:N-acetylglucosamine kinase-like BadF-type ATPase
VTSVIGIDIGGTGVRARLAQVTPNGLLPGPAATNDTRTRIGIHGVDAHATGRAVTGIIERLLTETGIRNVDAVAIGSTGLALLGDNLRHALPDTIMRTTGAQLIVLCSDVLTSYIGALGDRSGAVIAAGTGAVALGTDQHGHWQRSDGWGGLLGDIGGGAWIGRTAIDAALRAHDGRPGGSRTLLTALNNRYGDLATLVATAAASADRSGLLAAFASDVSACAATDQIAANILTEAGRHLADTLLAALPPTAERTAAATGKVFQAPIVHDGFTRRLADRSPELRLIPAAGTVLDGAIHLAAAALHGTLPLGADLHLYTGSAAPASTTEPRKGSQ